jgi:hypothetical protein
LASSNSVVATTPLTPPVLHVAELVGRASLQSALVLQVLPVKLQTPVFLVQFESTVQLVPALAELASQVPGLVVQFEFVVQAAPAFPEVALQVPPSVHWLLAVQVLVGWLLQ